MFPFPTADGNTTEDNDSEGGRINRIAELEPKSSEHSEYETGARKLVSRSWPDPVDNFSQDAAGNRPPPHEQGNSSPLSEPVDETHVSDGQNPQPHPHQDKKIRFGPRGHLASGPIKSP